MVYHLTMAYPLTNGRGLLGALRVTRNLLAIVLAFLVFGCASTERQKPLKAPVAAMLTIGVAGTAMGTMAIAVDDTGESQPFAIIMGSVGIVSMITAGILHLTLDDEAEKEEDPAE
jgi:hypothetical protein